MEKPKQKPAFASGWKQEGLTNREYYAAKFMAALIQTPEQFGTLDYAQLADKAVRLAEFLMIRLQQKNI